ncbi:MAG: hypothetical protein IPJ13_10200 [Saprospiraceae bacterium]|nr:hypothetical protein [Saprospiraceae bacterium]
MTWTGTSGNWFRVYRANTNNITRSTALGSWQNTMTYDDFTPNVGQPYFYWVRAASDNAGSISQLSVQEIAASKGLFRQYRQQWQQSGSVEEF